MQNQLTAVKRKSELLRKKRITQMTRKYGLPNVLQNGLWSDEIKIQAVTNYLAIGNLAQVHRDMNIPLETLRQWRKSVWWKELESELKTDMSNETAAVIGGIVAKTLDQIKERVAKGDVVYNPRSGETTRVPVSAANLNKIAATLIDRQLVLHKQPTKITASDESAKVENKLEQLAMAFKEFTTNNKKTHTIDTDRVIDLEIPDESK
jgi:transposase-like protein